MEFGMLKVGNSIDIQRTDGMHFDKIYVSSVGSFSNTWSVKYFIKN